MKERKAANEFHSSYRWVTIALLLILIPMFAFAAGQEEEKKHIVLQKAGWSGDYLPIYVPKILLEDELGYTVEVVELYDVASAIAVDAGEIQLNLILWFPNSEPAVREFLEKGTVVNLGVMYGDLPQGMFVPNYVAEEYGIKSITDLDKPEFAKMFDIDGDGKGDWIGCDPGWACAAQNDECITLYGLDELYTQMVGSTHLLKAAAIGRIKNKEPVLMNNFWPSDLFIDYPRGEFFTVLEDPQNFWKWAHVPKLANKEWVDENPKAAELMRQIEMTGEDVMWCMGEVRVRGDDPATLEAIGREWIEKHKDVVDSWLTAIK